MNKKCDNFQDQPLKPTIFDPIYLQYFCNNITNLAYLFDIGSVTVMLIETIILAHFFPHPARSWLIEESGLEYDAWFRVSLCPSPMQPFFPHTPSTMSSIHLSKRESEGGPQRPRTLVRSSSLDDQSCAMDLSINL